MSQRALSPQLFHGTASPLKKGDKVLPANVAGVSSNWGDTGSHRGQRSDEHAFATTSEKDAWYFAHSAAHNGDSRGYGQRPRVYEVAPNAQMKPGAYHKDLGEYVAPHFKIRDRIDIMPGHQGTLAGHGPEPFNWTPFHNDENPGRANHPDVDDDGPGLAIEYQHKVALRQHMRREELPGQQELFPPQLTSHMSTDAERTRHHLMRHLVNTGQAPAPELDHKLAEEESMDAFNARRGRRSSFAARYREGR